MVKPVLALIGSPKHAQRAPVSEVMHGLDAQALHSVRQLGRGPGDTAA